MYEDPDDLVARARDRERKGRFAEIAFRNVVTFNPVEFANRCRCAPDALFSLIRRTLAFSG